MPSVMKMAEMIVNGTPIEDIAAGFKPRPKIDEKKFRSLYANPRMPMREIGRQLGISGVAVKYRAKARGLPARENHKAYLMLDEKRLRLFALLYQLNAAPVDIVWIVLGKERGASGEGQRASEERKSHDSRLGTGHGRNETSYAQRVGFDRASSSPEAVVSIRYDRREALVARGIVPGPRYADRRPSPFPAWPGFVPDPR